MTDFAKALNGWQNDMVRTSHEMEVRLAQWLPAQGLPKMLFLGGLRCYAEKYTAEAETLAKMGYQMVTMDWRNQGRSKLTSDAPRELSYVDSYDEYLGDLGSLFPQVAPKFVIAHSMGAHLALRYWAQSQTSTPLVITAPFLGTREPPPAGLARFAAALGATFSDVGRKKVPLQHEMTQDDFGTARNIITTDKARFDELFNWPKYDPVLKKGPATFKWLNAFFKSLAVLAKKETLGRIRAPVLAFTTPNDPLVNGPVQAKLLQYVPGIEVVPLANSLHEPLRERAEIRDAVFAHIRGFVMLSTHR